MTRKVFTAALVLIAFAVVGTGCKKEKDTRARITVQKEDGARVAGAYVKLFANPIPPLQSDFSRLTQEGMTDGSGQVEFDYTAFYKQGQAGFAVLDIVSFKDSLVGRGIIRINEEETNEETVTLSVPDPD